MVLKREGEKLSFSCSSVRTRVKHSNLFATRIISYRNSFLFIFITVWGKANNNLLILLAFLYYIPDASFKSWALSVRSQENSGSWRPKCPYAAVER
jgi:hypothetical protein